MKARGIPGLLGRIAVVATFAAAVGLWALSQTSPAPGGGREAPGRRVLGNVKLLSHTATTTATLTYQQTGSQNNKSTRFTVTLRSSDPLCLDGRNVTVSRTSPATTLGTTDEGGGVYKTTSGTGRSGTWQATVTSSTYTTYGGETHTCSAATSNTVTVP